MKNNSEFKLKIAGIFFIAIGLIAIIQSIERGNIDQIFWVCYSAILIIGIGILTKNPYLIIAELNLLIVPSIFWNIDFFYQLITSQSLWGITDYFFSETRILQKIVSLQHVFVIPISLFCLAKIKLQKNNSWIISVFQMLIIFTLTITFTPIEQNINCINKSCINIINIDSNYKIAWIIIWTTIIIFTDRIISSFRIFNKK